MFQIQIPLFEGYFSTCYLFVIHWKKEISLTQISHESFIQPNVLTAGAPGSHMDGGPSRQPGRRATSHSAAGLRNEVELSRLKAPVEPGTSLRKTRKHETYMNFSMGKNLLISICASFKSLLVLECYLVLAQNGRVIFD